MVNFYYVRSDIGLRDRYGGLVRRRRLTDYLFSAMWRIYLSMRAPTAGS